MIANKEAENNEKEERDQLNNIENTKGLRERFLDIAGWSMMAFQSVPALFIWGGLMTLPFLMYLVLMFFSVTGTEVPLITERNNFYFFEALDIFFFGGNRIPEIIVSITGLFIMLYSVIYLRIRKPEGMVTHGPYHLVRHPQYLGVIVFTANLTSRSFRETLGDVGWIGPELTFLIWFCTLVAYIILAQVEEIHLSKKFGKQYDDYRRTTGFIFPFFKTKHKSLEIIITITIAVILMFSTVYFAEFIQII